MKQSLAEKLIEKLGILTENGWIEWTVNKDDYSCYLGNRQTVVVGGKRN